MAITAVPTQTRGSGVNTYLNPGSAERQIEDLCDRQDEHVAFVQRSKEFDRRGY